MYIYINELVLLSLNLIIYVFLNNVFVKCPGCCNWPPERNLSWASHSYGHQCSRCRNDQIHNDASFETQQNYATRVTWLVFLLFLHYFKAKQFFHQKLPNWLLLISAWVKHGIKLKYKVITVDELNTVTTKYCLQNIIYFNLY